MPQVSLMRSDLVKENLNAIMGQNPIKDQRTSINFDLRQLEAFCKVVELKSFSKAAKSVFLAQASVSERIATLENMVGTQLLDRLGRQVVPTKAGDLLYKHALRVLETKKTACLEMEAFLGMRQGEVHLGGSTIPGEYILPMVVGRFRETYPFISARLTISDTSAIEKQVADGKLELGVIGSKGFQKHISYQKLWQDELVVAVPAEHGLAKYKEVSLEALATEPFILREEGSGTLRITESYLENTGLNGVGSLDVVARFGSSTAVKEGIKAGLGISILSLRAIGTELKAGIIKALRVKDLRMSRWFYLITDDRRTASPQCKAMLNFLAEFSQD